MHQLVLHPSASHLARHSFLNINLLLTHFQVFCHFVIVILFYSLWFHFKLLLRKKSGKLKREAKEDPIIIFNYQYSCFTCLHAFFAGVF